MQGSVSSLRLGCVKYLNARPLIRGWEGPVVFEHPSVLCAQIARGDLEVALVSSFELLRRPSYRTVDGVSISSDGPVYSVFVAHAGDISQVEEIELDPASETSVNLLRCLLAESKLTPRLRPRPASLAGKQGARLIIGDQAIRFREEQGDKFNYWDLGQAWKDLVNLPFVYALWLIRPEVAQPNEVGDRLRKRRDENLAGLDALIAEEKEFARAFCAQYYGQNLRFAFGDREKEGLFAFRKLCQKHGLLAGGERSLSLA